MMIVRRGGCEALGFTLIELMIVVAVIAILSAIAYPSYTQYVLRTYRTQVKADMLEYVAGAERYHTVNNTYVGFKLDSEGGGVSSPRGATVARYTVTLLNQSASAFILSAGPTDVQKNDACGTLTIDQAGAKTSSGSAQTGCW